MLGILLYEIFDLVYYTGKLGFNGVRGVYRLYNGVSKINYQENNKDIIRDLEQRIKYLEEVNKESNSRK